MVKSFRDVALRVPAKTRSTLCAGMGLDAYLAIGRLHGGVQQHVWVLTREPNGNLRLSACPLL